DLRRLELLLDRLEDRRDGARTPDPEMDPGERPAAWLCAAAVPASPARLADPPRRARRLPGCPRSGRSRACGGPSGTCCRPGLRGATERRPMTGAFLIGSMLVFLVIGMPIAIALGLAGSLTIILFMPDSLASAAARVFNTMEHYTLLAMPFFILSSVFLTTGGVARRLIDFAVAGVGHIPGGLAVASVFACVLFAAISGSSPATVVAVGSIVIAGMIRTGYSPMFAAGCVCTAGTLGILLPPSIPMIAYSATTETSVGRLFLAGVMPGLLLGLVLAFVIYVYARITGLPRMERATWGEMAAAGARAGWGLLLIVIIM